MRTIIFVLIIMAGLIKFEFLNAQSGSASSFGNIENPGGSKLISDWITVQLKTIRTCKIPRQHFRQMAYTGVALYESIVAEDKNYRSLAGQLNGYQPPKSLPETSNICWPASANAAIAEMFRYFYPQNQADIMSFDSLQNDIRHKLAREGYNETAISNGEKYGSKIALSVIEWSKTDGDDKVNAPYSEPLGPGLWEPTPPMFIPPIMPYLGNERTFVSGSIDNNLPPKPLSFSTEPQSDFYKMNEEVYLVSKELDESKKAIALFWDDFPDGKTLTASGHWESILKTLLNDLNVSLIEGAHLYAGMFITMNDAAIGCFKAKYTYNQLRPVTYIQKYMGHNDWNPLIITPPHPEYPAAHATVSMAVATILTKMLGENISFTDNTYAYRGYAAHHFNSIKDAAIEAGISRFYGGIHYIKSIEAGYAQGEKVAENIYNKLVFIL